MRRAWLHSAPFDLSLLILPPLFAALAVLAVPGLRAEETPVWAWVVFVVGLDVAHVYASLYRVYWDPVEFARKRAFYLNTPIACLAAGVLLHRASPLWFWRVLAYAAVFHFVRQQYGFMRLYQKLEDRPVPFDKTLDAAAVYAAMLYPLAFWHASRDRVFAWFVDGDFVRLPFSLPAAAAWLYAALLAAFFARQIQRAASGARVSLAKSGVVAATAASWYVGIVWLNSDLAFTVTNVVAHGIPYFGLVWLCGRRRWLSDGGWRGLVFKPWAWALFLLPLVVLAYGEEWVWDLLVWKEHASVFAGAALNRHFGVPHLQASGWLNIVVPLLALPQATHYALDAWIWRLDGTNPDLARELYA
jgi:hypothetical protein